MLSGIRRGELLLLRVQSHPCVEGHNAEQGEINRIWSAFSAHGIDIKQLGTQFDPVNEEERVFVRGNLSFTNH